MEALPEDLTELSSFQNCLAKALYDNHAESPEELEFKKSDVLTVLEQNPNGLQGWWLCALRGRQGIAPGNRLRLIPYMYDQTGLGFATGVAAQNIQQNSACTLPNRGSNANRRPLVGSPLGNRVILPVRQGDSLVYDTPQANVKSEYDVPSVATLPRGAMREPPKLQTFATQNYDEPKVSGGQYDIPRGIVNQMNSLSLSDGQYDFPNTSKTPYIQTSEYDAPAAARSAVAPLKAASLYDKPPNQDLGTFKEKSCAYDVPVPARGSIHSQSSSSGVTGSQSSLNTSLSSSSGGSNRSSLEQQSEEAYDIPQHSTKKTESPIGLLKIATRLPTNSNGFSPQSLRRDNLQSPSSLEAAEYAPLPKHIENPLELSSALETLVYHQNEVQTAMQLLFASLGESRQGMRVPSHTLLNSVTTFLTFLLETLRAAKLNTQDARFVCMLERLIQNVAISYKVISESCTAMDQTGWAQEKQGERDELDRLVACARNLSDDVQQISSCIQGNASLIFRRPNMASNMSSGRTPVGNLPSANVTQRPLPRPPTVRDEPVEYDYIQMQNDHPVKEEMSANFENLVKRSKEMVAEKSSVGDVPVHIQNDQMLRDYYSPRLNESIAYLSEAIDAFLATIEKNQPPRVFVEHTKFILIAAHRVACIGDTLHRHLSDYTESDKFRRSSEKISTSLRLLVDTTKRAALHYPAVLAIQEMVDTVMAVSHLCQALKGCFVVNTSQRQCVQDATNNGGVIVK